MPIAPNTETTNGYTNDVNNSDNNGDIEKSLASLNIDDRSTKDIENGKSDSSSMEEDLNSSDSGYKPKTPSTAERRKAFEFKVKDDSPENEDMENFERDNSNKNSIAERRRLYESHSVSMTDGNLAEKATDSPTLIRRRDSFKTKSEMIKEDEGKKVTPISSQHSLDSKLDTAPTPKRTSTVFGRVSKFRHLKGTPGHKSTHIENIKNISRQVSGECDGFHGKIMSYHCCLVYKFLLISLLHFSEFRTGSRTFEWTRGKNSGDRIEKNR